MKFNQIIEDVTRAYFNDTLDLDELKIGSERFESFLQELIDDQLTNENQQNDINLHDGLALGTIGAAACLHDVLRTRKFYRGIDNAIKDGLSKNASLHILYAGTGPYATLLLPFLFRYADNEIRYTFLEVNARSLKVLEHLLTKLGIRNKVKLVLTDATQYDLGIDKPDIVVSETMQNALMKEPQVSIYHHLMQQIDYKALFIPEKISVSIGVMKEFNAPETIRNIGTVYELSKSVRPKITGSNMEFSEQLMEINAIDLEGFKRLALLTEIQVYNDDWIRMNESGLTTPLAILDIKPSDNPIAISTKYVLGSNPRLTYSFVY